MNHPTRPTTIDRGAFRLSRPKIAIAIAVAALLIPGAIAARGVPAVGVASGGLVPICAAAVAAGLIVVAVLHAFGAHRTAPAELAVLGVVLFGVVFQAAHFLEHFAQLGYWLINPSAKPWLTPWAATAVDGRAFLGRGPADPRAAMAALEYLHLVGNGIFFAAVFLLNAKLRDGAGSRRARRSARRALVWQSIHFGEHVVLVATLITTGSTLGASTLFGLVEPAQPAMWTFRVLMHFALNAIPTYYAVQAVIRARHKFVSAGRLPQMATAPVAFEQALTAGSRR